MHSSALIPLHEQAQGYLLHAGIGLQGSGNRLLLRGAVGALWTYCAGLLVVGSAVAKDIEAETETQMPPRQFLT